MVTAGDIHFIGDLATHILVTVGQRKKKNAAS